MISMLVPMADNPVRPGWIPLIIVLALGAVVAFLYFSMRKQLGKIDFPDEGVPTHPEANENGDAPKP
jgi:hypothetical protein